MLNGLSWWLRQYRICLQFRRRGFNSWVWKIPWRREWATHSSIHAWRIPWTEEPGRLQSMGSQRVGCDLGTKQLWGLNQAGCVNSLEQGRDTTQWGLQKRRGLLASSLSISQGYRREESQAPCVLLPTFQVDHRATSQVGLRALGLTLGSDPRLSSMGSKRRLPAEPQSPRHVTRLKAAGGEPGVVFNIPGTLSSNSAEAFRRGWAELPRVSRLALFHTIFAPLTA